MPSSPPPVSVTLIGKPGCHLCDMAREVLQAVVREFDAGSHGRPVTVSELSILDDDALFERYAEEIPVVLINGSVHTIYRVDSARLLTALQRA